MPTTAVSMFQSETTHGYWKHITVSWNSGTASIYVDGVLLTTNAFEIPHGDYTISTTPGSNVHTWFDDFRIYDRALTQDDVDVLYAKDNTMGGCYDRTVCATAPVETDGLYIHFPFDNAGEQRNMAPLGPDIALVVTGTGTATIEQSGVVGAAYTRTTSNTVYTYADTSAQLLSTMQLKLTVTAWARFDTDGTATIFQSNIFDVLIKALGIRVHSRGETAGIQYGGGSRKPNRWYHIACVADVSTATTAFTVYVNGELSFQRDFDTGSHDDVFTRIIAGAQYSEPSTYVDDLRIYNRALSVTEVAALYRARDTVPADCLAEVSSGTAVAYNSAVEPVVQSSFLFYCSDATNVSFSVHRELASADAYTPPVRFKAETPEWGYMDPNLEAGHTQYEEKDSVSGDRYMVHKFMHTGGLRTSGTQVQTQYTMSFAVQTTIDILVVGGGGGGGGVTGTCQCAAGGGSGGEYNLVLQQSVSGEHVIMVAAGGLGSVGSIDGMSGSNSAFGTAYTSIGGGGGARSAFNSRTVGVQGAYGGGSGCGARNDNSGGTVAAVCGLADENICGGEGQWQQWVGSSGGGGGCGGSGRAAITGRGGDGGLGLSVPEFSVEVCGGGAGSTRYCVVSDATHGGGTSGPTTDAFSPDGVAGTGGGGAGAGQSCASGMGHGGSGVVMLRYRLPTKGGSPLPLLMGVTDSAWVDDVVEPSDDIMTVTQSDDIMTVTQSGLSDHTVDGHTQYVVEDSVSGDMYMVHKFMHTGGTTQQEYGVNVNTTYQVNFPSTTIIDLLVVAGGGAGGYGSGEACGGGGSAGEVVELSGIVANGFLSIAVGAGGGPQAVAWYNIARTNEGMDGSQSTFGDTIAIHGGGGGKGQRLSNSLSWHTSGRGGAYGTGGSASKQSNSGWTNADGAAGQRPVGNVHTGGASYGYFNDASPVCGGGGGAGGSGLPGTQTPRVVGLGGVGVNVPNFQIDVGGGGSGANRYGRTGSSHGGGGVVNSAVDGTGGGGGGGMATDKFGGAGGSGIVMLRYRIGPKAVWHTTQPLFAMSVGPHTLSVGMSAGVDAISHIRFATGTGSCYFYTDKDPNTAVCTQCPSGQESVQPQNNISTCQPCTGVGRVFDENTKECSCAGTGRVFDENTQECSCAGTGRIFNETIQECLCMGSGRVFDETTNECLCMGTGRVFDENTQECSCEGTGRIFNETIQECLCMGSGRFFNETTQECVCKTGEQFDEGIQSCSCIAGYTRMISNP
ncbi:hypothetical protein T484DRAFT_1740640 [Baffinella frigidus]|nr:hypothetical protein T484DRAFT_1740640 [Cryptophyta sp. CCMP2293]